MDEYQHAELHREFMKQFHAVMARHQGKTSSELTEIFEREGLLALALRLPDVRQALTIVLLQSVFRNTATGEEYLDLDEERLLT
jgi:hypothetical protein